MQQLFLKRVSTTFSYTFNDVDIKVSGDSGSLQLKVYVANFVLMVALSFTYCRQTQKESHPHVFSQHECSWKDVPTYGGQKLDPSRGSPQSSFKEPSTI